MNAGRTLPFNHRIVTVAILIAVLLLAVFALSGCAGATPSPEPAAATMPPSPSSVPTTATQVPTGTPAPTDTPIPTETLLPIPTLTASPTSLPAEAMTLGDARLFAGPDSHLPLVASYTGGITLTVLGSSEDRQWLVIEIPPGQPGWSQAANFQLAQDPLALVILPTPAGLATVTPVPMAGVRVAVSFDSFRDSFGAHAVTYINISTGQAKTAFDVEILKPDGKRLYIQRNILTDNDGRMTITFFDKPVPNGSYTLVLTDTSGNLVQKTFEVLKQ